MSMKNLSIMQLNCRSIGCKLGAIKLLIYTRKPNIVAFCETWLDKYLPQFVDYSCEWKNRSSFAGGLGFLIKKGIQYQNVQLVPYPNRYLEFQTIKLRWKSGKVSYIMNVYNPGRPVSVNEIDHYVRQLGNNFHIVGDFNAHTKLLDSKCVKPNATGISIKNIVGSYNICLMNPINFYTYVSAYGKRSCLDLCLASPNFAPITHMKQLPDVGSDHIPINIIVECEPCNIKISYPRRWKTDDEALTEFNIKLSGSENVNIRPDSLNNITGDFTKRIFESAENTIKRTSGRVKSN